MNSEIGVRIRTCAEIVGSGDAISQKTGIPRSTLETYLTGKAEPKASRLVAIADAAGVSVEWLATGRGAMRPDNAAPAKGAASGIDRDLLAAAYKGIAELYRSENARISADPLADEVARIYDDLVETYDSTEERLTGLKVMLHQLRRDLRIAPATNADRKKKASSE